MVLPILMPRLAAITIAGDVSGLLTLSVDGSGETSFDAGSVESASDATRVTLDTNDSWDLSVKRDGAWTDPTGYDKAENDLQIRITNTPTGTIDNGADSYITLTTSDTQILSHPSAVSSNQVDVQTKVLLDWTKDIPGTYSMSLTYTLVTHLP